MDAGTYNVQKAACGTWRKTCIGATEAFIESDPWVLPLAASVQETFTAQYNAGTQYNITSAASWSSGNASIATVSTGKVTAHVAGTTTVGADDPSIAIYTSGCYGYMIECPLETGEDEQAPGDAFTIQLLDNGSDQVGVGIYPQTVAPGVRHLIEHNFVITDAGRLLFIADRLSSGELCLVRLSVSYPPDRASKENCTTSATFEVSSLSEVHIRQFAENPFGDLVLSVDIGEPNTAARRNFDIDRTSLTITPVPVEETRDTGNFPIPWSVQRKALTVFVPLRVAAEPNEAVKVRVIPN